MSIKAIETRYAGHRFRSRTEARWAVFFDALKTKWEYEPEGYVLPGDRCYLVDFYLPEWGMYAEVKGADLEDADFSKAIELSTATGKPVLLLFGSPVVAPFPCFDPTIGARTDCVLTNCGIGHPSTIYWNSGGCLRPFAVEEMCQGITEAVAAAKSARFEAFA